MPDILRKREASWKRVTEGLVCSAGEVRIGGREEHGHWRIILKLHTFGPHGLIASLSNPGSKHNNERDPRFFYQVSWMFNVISPFTDYLW